VIGHGGEDWGSGGFGGYIAHYDFSFSIMWTAGFGMNCSKKGEEWLQNAQVW